MTNIDIIKDVLVYLFVYIPPLMLFLRFWRERHKGKVLPILITVLYIIFSLFTQNLLPFILVVLSIRYLRLASEYNNVSSDENSYQHSKETISIRIKRDYEKFKFSLKKFNLLLAMKLALISYLITIVISVLETVVLLIYKVEVEQQEIVTYMTNMPLNKFLVMIPTVIIFAPIVEEFVFRWLLFEKVFTPRIGIYFSALLSSIIFGFIHFNLRSFPVLLWIAMYNCYLIRKKGYWYSVFNHFTFNLVTTMTLLFEKLGMLKF